MPKRLFERVESRFRARLGLPPKWVQESILGNQVVVRDGTLGTAPDYDDAWLLACARRATTMFDVGANVGKSAVIALVCAKIPKVVLVEPNIEALTVAAENLIRNRLSPRACFVPAFASDESDKTVSLFTIGTGAAGSMFEGHAVSASRAGSVQQVSTVTLDQLAATYDLIPDLVKIDVEGAEAAVLAGSKAVASVLETRFLVEMHSFPELPMRRNAELVLEWASSVGYSVWYPANECAVTSAEPICHRGRCHLLLQPRGWEYPAWLRGIAQSAPLAAVAR